MLDSPPLDPRFGGGCSPEECHQMRQERDALRSELDALRALMAGDIKDFSITCKDGKAEVSMKHWAVRLMAASLADSLGDAPNCVAVDLTHETVGKMEVLVRRVSGQSVAEVIDGLRAKIAAATQSATQIERARCASLLESMAECLSQDQPADTRYSRTIHRAQAGLLRGAAGDIRNG